MFQSCVAEVLNFSGRASGARQPYKDEKNLKPSKKESYTNIKYTNSPPLWPLGTISMESNIHFKKSLPYLNFILDGRRELFTDSCKHC